MRKPGARSERLIALLLVMVVAYGLIEYVLPPQLNRWVHAIVGDRLTFERVALRWPGRVVLSNVRLPGVPVGAPISSPELVVHPIELSPRNHTLHASRIDADGLRMIIQRRPDGRLEPAAWAMLGPPIQSPSVAPPFSQPPRVESWRITADTMHIGHGVVAFVDEKLVPPFRAMCDGLTISAGPVTLPSDGSLVSVAIQGRLVAAHEEQASIYCSGWLNAAKGGVDLACRLEPIRLSAFEPYYQGRIQVRAYNAMLAATAQCTAKANAFEARIQLQIDHLDEADLSYGSRTILDIKRIAEGQERVLSGELKLTGPLDRPAEWKVRFLPGNVLTQRLAEFFDRPLDRVTLTMGGDRIQLGVTPADATERSDMESTSETVRQHLWILAPEVGRVDLSPAVAPAVPSGLVEPSAPSTSSESAPQAVAPGRADGDASSEPPGGR